MSSTHTVKYQKYETTSTIFTVLQDFGDNIQEYFIVLTLKAICCKMSESEFHKARILTPRNKCTQDTFDIYFITPFKLMITCTCIIIILIQRSFFFNLTVSYIRESQI